MSRKPMEGIYIDSFHHGTYNGYANHGCRCDECRAAAREWRQAWYAKPENAAKRRAQVRAQRKRYRAVARSLPPAPMTGKRWTATEDRIVLSKDRPLMEIAHILKRSHKSVSRRREVLRSQGRDWS